MRLVKKGLMIGSVFIVSIGSLFLNTSTIKANEPDYPISSSEVFVDGKRINYPIKPIVKDETTLVPIRETFEAMGATVKWVQHERAVYATKGETEIKMTVDSTSALTNEQQITLTAPPILYKGKTMIPLRYVGEAFDGKVHYDPTNKKINITMPKVVIDFLEKEQINISNIKNIDNVKMSGNRRLMVSDNPEVLDSNTINEDNATLAADIFEEKRNGQDHRVFGWHINKLAENIQVGITIENLSPTNTIQIRNLQGIHKISSNSFYAYEIGLPISSALLHNRLFGTNTPSKQIKPGESIQLESITLKPNEIIGLVNDFTVAKITGAGEMNYIIRTVISKDNSDLAAIKTPPVPTDPHNFHSRGVWSSSELSATFPTYKINEDGEVSYSISNGITDNLLNAETSLMKNATSVANKGHFGVVYKVKVPYINESAEEKTVRVRIASRGGIYSGSLKIKDDVINIPSLKPMKDVANLVDYKITDNKGFIEFDIVHAGGSSLPIAINIITLD
ncbi:stalk domain-containing protein [Lysinibacillus sp. BW-2-10]|uniref:stalk domain-containing protein n=1 Tax=Lysinibacillus sp. BW-2-10 TaxID=2590030 RepID=UPI001642F0D6|nr:stalk domain-containing protein [Lysinibacillus sp. BW-2-10]